MKKIKSNISGVSDNLSNSITEDIQREQQFPDLLNNVNVGVSVSDSDEYSERGFSKIHQKDITIELTRYLLLNGAHVIYGGDLRNEGYTNSFSELSFQYRKINYEKKKLFTNYFAWPIHLNLKPSDEAEFKRNRVRIIKVDCPQIVPKQFRNEVITPDDVNNRLYLASSLSQMRSQMISDCHARIAIGGRTSDYMGFYPGIIEEAYLAVKMDKPLYIIGAFGGAAEYVIRALNGETAQKLSDELFELFPAQKNFESHSKTATKDFVSMKQALSTISKYGLKKIKKATLLTDDELKILFTTNHIYEMIYFIMAGLSRISKRGIE